MGQEKLERANSTRAAAAAASHYIKEEGYVTTVGSCSGTQLELNASRCVRAGQERTQGLAYIRKYTDMEE